MVLALGFRGYGVWSLGSLGLRVNSDFSVLDSCWTRGLFFSGALSNGI